MTIQFILQISTSMNFPFRPLTEEQQESARNRRFMEIRLRLFLQELISYIIFLMFLALVARGYRDTDEYYFSKALRDDIVHSHFDNVSKYLVTVRPLIDPIMMKV